MVSTQLLCLLGMLFLNALTLPIYAIAACAIVVVLSVLNPTGLRGLSVKKVRWIGVAAAIAGGGVGIWKLSQLL